MEIASHKTLSAFFYFCGDHLRLTQHASVEFDAHSNVPVPGPHVHTDISRCKWFEETMGNDKVPFLIGWEDLFDSTKATIVTTL